ncbi:MAG: HAD-IB family hydrolase [Bacteroidetes bacterium]|nr:HAD-IB family hydrolase [Bacteroidota bacterium]
MISSRNYLTLFDLDRTIFSINSGNILVQQAYKHRLISTKEFLKAIYLGISYRLRIREPMTILLEMARWMKGISGNDLQILANQIVDKYLIDKIRPDIYREIQMHKEKGAHIGILSAALPIICQPVARQLKIDAVICSEMEIVNGKYSGNVMGKLCYGENKRIRLQDYCADHGYQLKDTYYYADSYSDRSVLEAVGYPFCIKPDIRLRKLAKKNNWQIPEWS